MQDDSLLLRQAQRGDTQAFEALVAPHEKRVYAICLRMLGNREDALDCAQEAMLCIWRAIGSYRRDAAFATWCYRIATNTCLDLLRKRRARPAVSLEVMADLGYIPAAQTGDPQAEAEHDARRRAMALGLSQLTDEHRAALILRDIQGFSYEEVADILHLSLGTVKSRISRAREKLRTLLSQHAELFGRDGVQGEERRMDI